MQRLQRTIREPWATHEEELTTPVAGVQLEDVLSWQCGHPQVRSMQSSAGKDATEAAGGGDLQLDVLSNLERHVDRLSAFSDEEDEAELHNLYMVSVHRNSVF